MNKENEISHASNQGWTKELKSLPSFSYDLLQRHLIGETQKDDCANGAHRHKKLGYQLFKDRYVSQVQVKPGIKKECEDMYFLVKGTVHASMKKMSYVVYVHLNQENGSVVYAKCSCKAGKGGCCKHVAALLFQIIDYIQLELKEVPDDVTCTQVLQRWHVPRMDETDEAVLFEDLHFEKASFEKDSKETKPLKRAVKYNPTPHFAREPNQKGIEKLAEGLEQVKPNYLSKLLKSNNYQPVPFEELHNNLPSKRKRMQDITCLLDDTDIRKQILHNLKEETTEWMDIEEGNMTLIKEKLGSSNEKYLEIERNTRGQSECSEWYEERRVRLTASNFGTVIKCRKHIYPKSLLRILQGQSNKQKTPVSCKWGKDNESIAHGSRFEFFTSIQVDTRVLKSSIPIWNLVSQIWIVGISISSIQTR